MLSSTDSCTPVAIKLPDNLYKAASGAARHLQIDHDDGNYMTRCLDVLWRMVAAPVVAELDRANVPRSSRTWWCPTAALSALPLHAAQSSPIADAEPLRLSDHFTSSYTTTISSLIAARANLRVSSTLRSLLIVATPQADPPLPEVQRELAAVISLGPFVTALSRTAATPVAVLQSLATYDLVHFACHAHVSMTFPSESHFALHGGAPLRVLDVLRAKISTQLAALSACSTAVSSPDGTPDEALHPAAALQFSVLPSVIGTLWTMKDAEGPEFASAFYKYLLGDTGNQRLDVRNSVWALNAATNTLRWRVEESYNRVDDGRGVLKGSVQREGHIISGVGRWATFAHFGT